MGKIYTDTTHHLSHAATLGTEQRIGLITSLFSGIPHLVTSPFKEQALLNQFHENLYLMTSTSPRPHIRVHRGIYEVFELLRNKGMFDLVRTHKEKGIMTVLTHLTMEFEATGDPRFRDAHEWIVKHRDDFIWGVTDGFAIG